MSNTSQKHAIKNYRDRLAKRGMARFEVLALEADRDLIRSLAKRLADDGPDAAGFGRWSAEHRRRPSRQRAAFWKPCAVHPWSGPILTLRGRMKPAARLTCDPLPPRHQHNQQHHQAHPFGIAAGLDGGTTRRGPIHLRPHHRRNPARRSGKAGRTKTRPTRSLVFRPGRPFGALRGPVLPFDEKAGMIWARLMAEGTAKGRPRSALDTIIAAIAEANDCIVVTDNKKDFADVGIVNPLR